MPFNNALTSTVFIIQLALFEVFPVYTNLIYWLRASFISETEKWLQFSIYFWKSTCFVFSEKAFLLSSCQRQAKFMQMTISMLAVN